LRLGLLGYTNDEINLDYYRNHKHVFLDEYLASGQWDLIEVPAKIEYIKDNSLNKTIQQQMVFSFKMKRKKLFHTINLIIPIFLLACLSICVFYLPTESKEKINLSLSILCSMVFYFLLLVKQLPQNGIVIPLISKYILFTFILNFLSVLITCVIINNYYKDSNIHKMNKFIRTIFINYLNKLVRLKSPLKSNKLFISKQNKNINTLRSIFANSRLYRIDKLNNNNNNNINSSIRRYTKSVEFNDLLTFTQRVNRRNGILHSSKSIEYISNTLIIERLNEKTKQYWKHFSSILDRIMLILFIFVTLLITYELLFKVPSLFNTNFNQDHVLNENSVRKRPLRT
jgi:nicotinic acetylcholine receptor, invertebrate